MICYQRFSATNHSQTMQHWKLYEDVCMECSKLITQRYSTSFTLGIRTLARKYQLPIYAIYGFVRYADEIVDTFHQHNKALLLTRFKQDTYTAIADGVSLNPVLHSFQAVVNEYHIEHELIEAFLRSMEMDLHKSAYDAAGYDEYIYGSAEVVGLMCLRVFCEGDDAEYYRLRESARSLGKAFQKVNFLRDLRSDHEDRGRVYFPQTDFSHFDNAAKADIEADIAKDFAHAYEGIMQLPTGARMGVYLAYQYYMRLFDKIRSLPASHIMRERVRVADGKKFALLAQTYFRHQLNLL